MNTMRIKVKDSRRLKLFCVVMLFIAVTLMQGRWLYSYDYPDVKSVVVSEGESLWDIAKRYKAENEDTRTYICKVKELNLLDTSQIFEGQELKVPVMQEVN